MAVVATYVAFAVTGLTGSYWRRARRRRSSQAPRSAAAVERGRHALRSAGSPLSGVIIAIGLVMVLQSALGILFGPQYRPMAAPFDESPLTIGGVPVLSPYDLFVFVVALGGDGRARAAVHPHLAGAAAARIGVRARRCRACSGVRVSRMLTIGWMLSSAVAALAALLLVPTELGLNPHSTDMLFVYAFTVAVVGGLDSPVGALVGGLVVGVVISLVTGYLGATVAPIAVLVLLRRGAARAAGRHLLGDRGAHRMSAALPAHPRARRRSRLPRRRLLGRPDGARARRHLPARPVPQLPARPRRRVLLRHRRAHAAHRTHRPALARARGPHGGRWLRLRAHVERADRCRASTACRASLRRCSRRRASASGALGLLLGLAGARLHGPYLAGLTLALVIAAARVRERRSPRLRRRPGRADPVRRRAPVLVGSSRSSSGRRGSRSSSPVVVTRLARSRGGPPGLRMRAVRDDETAARLTGIAPGRSRSRVRRQRRRGRRRGRACCAS